MIKKLLLKWLDKEVKQYAIEQLKIVQKDCMNNITYPLDFKGKKGAGARIQSHINALSN